MRQRGLRTSGAVTVRSQVEGEEMEKEGLEGQRGRVGKSGVLDPKAREVGVVRAVECSGRAVA